MKFVIMSKLSSEPLHYSGSLPLKYCCTHKYFDIIWHLYTLYDSLSKFLRRQLFSKYVVGICPEKLPCEIKYCLIVR